MSNKTIKTFTASQYNAQARECNYCGMIKSSPCLYQAKANHCSYLKHKIIKRHEQTK